jgi:hypothetical protein
MAHWGGGAVVPKAKKKQISSVLCVSDNTVIFRSIVCRAVPEFHFRPFTNEPRNKGLPAK